VKTIDTLTDDIYSLLDKGGTFGEDAFQAYGRGQSTVLGQRLHLRGDEGPQGLRLSSIGKPCVRQLWYGIHAPLHREPLRPHTRLKFLYGDLVEELLLELARKAGHTLEGEQGNVLVNGVKGHRDVVIDGMLVDVKSASSFSFKKFQGGLQREDDTFGYLTQLGSYLLGSQEDDLVTYKNEAAFLVMDKVTGHLCLDRHTFTGEDFDKISETISRRTKSLSDSSLTPNRGFESIPEGKSGNRKLGVNCSYCDFKDHCWEGLRTFVYSGGRPIFLTHVEKVPQVPEVTKE